MQKVVVTSLCGFVKNPPVMVSSSAGVKSRASWRQSTRVSCFFDMIFLLINCFSILVEERAFNARVPAQEIEGLQLWRNESSIDQAASLFELHYPGSQATSITGPFLWSDVPRHPVSVPPATLSTSSGVNSRAPTRFNTRFDIDFAPLFSEMILNNRCTSGNQLKKNCSLIQCFHLNFY